MAFGKVDLCGIRTSSLPSLSESELVRLLEETANGNMQARKKLIEGNLRLVLSVMQRFASRGENPDDLFQVGCIGLIKAVDHFDIHLNVKFSTYAVPMIIGEIRRFLRDNNAVRVSRSLRDTAYHAMQIRERLQNEQQQEPTAEQIAAEMGLPKEAVVIAIESIVSPVSLSEPLYNDGGDTVYVADTVSGTEDERDWTDEICLRDALKNLSPREKKILHLRFMLGKTQTEVAAEIGVSQAQVSRIEKTAMDRLRT